MEKNTEQDSTNKSLSFFLKMKAFFPKSKKIYFLIYILKLIPLIVITHDWNITSKYSISFWIRKFTFSEIINDFKNIYFLYILLYFYSFLTSISIILSFYQIFSHKYNDNYICFIQYISLILNYMFLFFINFY